MLSNCFLNNLSVKSRSLFDFYKAYCNFEILPKFHRHFASQEFSQFTQEKQKNDVIFTLSMSLLGNLILND